MSIKADMELARSLIQAKRYDEARVVLKRVDHPLAREWLEKLETRVSAPTNAQKVKRPAIEPVVVQKAEGDYLYKASPSMWRNHPILFSIVLFFSFFMIGLPILFRWWLSTKNTTLLVTKTHVTLRKGILSKRISEIRLSDVRNVKINQGIFQRMLKTGVLEISTASGQTDDIVVSGLPDPYRVREIINGAR